MIGPLRKVFRKTADGEEGPLDFLALKAGDTFRMEPPDNCFDPECPEGWMKAKTDGFIQDGIQTITIVCEKMDRVMVKIPIEEPCKTN